MALKIQVDFINKTFDDVVEKFNFNSMNEMALKLGAQLDGQSDQISTIIYVEAANSIISTIYGERVKNNI